MAWTCYLPNWKTFIAQFPSDAPKGIATRDESIDLFFQILNSFASKDFKKRCSNIWWNLDFSNVSCNPISTKKIWKTHCYFLRWRWILHGYWCRQVWVVNTEDNKRDVLLNLKYIFNLAIGNGNSNFYSMKYLTIQISRRLICYM